MKNFMSNIKVKLIFAFIVFLIVPAITIGFLSYSTAKNAIENDTLHGIEQTISLLNSTIDSTIQPKIIDMDYFSQKANAKMIQDENSPDLRLQLDQYMKMHPEALDIYLGTATGIYVQEPRITDTKNYDPRERDWYKQAIENKGKTIISEPYEDAGTKKMVITISKSTADGNGVVAVDLLLTYLQEITNQIKIGDNGYTLLLDKNKKFIAHPTEAGGTVATQEFYNDMYKKNQGSFTYSLDNKDKVMSFITNDLTGWKVAGNLYTSELGKAAAPIFQKTLLIIIISILIGAFVMFFIVKSIMKPINQLKRSCHYD